MIKLRSYQEELKNKCREAFKKYKRVIMLAPCGSGKTITSTSIINDSVKKGNIVWFIVHRKELLDQAVNTLKRCEVPMDNVKVYMIQSLANRLDEIEEIPNFIILDECFAKGTLIDNIPIENIKVGDFINSYNHKTHKIEKKEVINIYKKKANNILKIKFDNGKEIICTANHPFYTSKGYIPAYKLKRSDELYLLWQKSNKRINKISKIYIQKNWKSVLFKRVYEKIFVRVKLQKNEKIERNKSRNVKKTSRNENKESNVYTRNKGKNERKYKEESCTKKIKWTMLVSKSRRKWKRIYYSTNKIIRSIKKIESNFRICSSNKIKTYRRLSILLQNRHSNNSTSNSNRSRWQKSRANFQKRTRPKKRYILKRTRVESIEIQKSTSDGTFGGLCKDGYVYNLEVKDNNNYFANNVLVHNCQHSTSKTYLRLINKFPNAYFLGLTATPCRLSGKPLGDIFQYMVSAITTEDLIKQGYLAQYDYYAPKTNADFTKVKIKNGDYDTEEIEKVMDNKKIYGNIIEEYKKLANNKKTIIYCASISYSKKIEKLFNDNGFSAKHFDGTTPKNERDQIIEDFRNNKIKILTNVDLIGEGFDVPDCECCLLLRPTQSLSLYIQQSTRCLRPNGDKRAIIIDFVGNVFRHGMPTENREWSLNQKITCQNRSGERDILTRQCRNCFKVYQGTNRICPYCGFDNGKTRKELKEEQKAELERIEKIEKKKRKEETRNKSYEELVKIGYQRGYKNPEYWAKIRVEYRERFKRK